MNAKQNETVLAVEGMSCPSCVSHINQALKELEGVGAVDVKLREGKVVVGHDANRAPIATLVEALKDAGYESTPAAL